MGLLSFEEIDAASDRATKDIPVKEWGGEVRLLEWSAKELDLWEAELTKRRLDEGKFDQAGLRLKVLSWSLIDEAGKPLANGKIEALARKNAKVIHRLYDEALKFNRIGEKAVEAEAKN